MDPEDKAMAHTHPATLLSIGLGIGIPSMFSLDTDAEWNDTHYTFVGPEGSRFRVDKDDVRMVCQRPKGVPDQPPCGFAVIFEDGSIWWRNSNDGHWYMAEDNGMNKATRKDWDELFAERGTVHWQAMMPVGDDQLPLLVAVAGPTETIIIPKQDPETGETKPWLIAYVHDETEHLVLRNVQDNTEINVCGHDAVNIFSMWYRTLHKRRGSLPKVDDSAADVPATEDTANKE